MNDRQSLANDVCHLSSSQPGRLILGLTGPPASGKSTLATYLSQHLAHTCVLAMDGFHLDDTILKKHGAQNRKGAPDTFDVDGFTSLLKRLRSVDRLFAPAFDRDLEISRNAAVEIPADTKTVIVEGNYLLHDAGGWQNVRQYLDACWYIDAPQTVLKKRMTARWLGFGYSTAAASQKVEQNDLPNAKTVSASRDRADRIIHSC